jgi:hypothetical protein
LVEFNRSGLTAAAMKTTKREWLRPLGFATRSITYACLFWLRWLGVLSFHPEDDDIHDGWSYLGLSIIFVLSGVALFTLTRP